MIYLDNAATTPLDPEVFQAMKPFLMNEYGNPSSLHTVGRKVKTEIEQARKKIAELMECTPAEIIFTSGGTEADNTLIGGAIKKYGIKHLISSPLEHHAVSHSLCYWQNEGLELHHVKCLADGHIDMEDLQALLVKHPNALVSLMHANNEIGNLLDLQRVGELCQEHGAYFHSDTVPTIGRYALSLGALPLHGAVASAHKFHGPKGVGFMYVDREKKIAPFVLGGPQERGLRGGTENVSGIIGLATALEICYRDMADCQRYVMGLKLRMIEKLRERISGVEFHGDSANMEKSHYAILNVSLPESEANDMLLFNLDMRGIAASGGSACSSGAGSGSHVLNALYPESRRGAVRFSFSKLNTEHNVDFTVEKLVALCNVTA